VLALLLTPGPASSIINYARIKTRGGTIWYQDGGGDPMDPCVPLLPSHIFLILPFQFAQLKHLFQDKKTQKYDFIPDELVLSVLPRSS
jgi:hypothetical protein